MAFVKREGFTFFENGEWGDFLVIETERLPDCISYLKKRKIKNVHLNSYYGYKSKDVNFLSSVGFIEGLTATEKLDLSGLSSLHNLKVLGIPDNGKDVIDLANYPNLKRCAVTFSKRLRGLETCKQLTELVLSAYESNTNDLTAFPELSLEKLHLIKSGVKSLEGIGRLRSLRTLQCSFMKSLLSVSALKEISNTLEVLEFDGCKKIADLDQIGKVSQLKKLILGNCGEVSSLSFIGELPKLRFFSFVDTNVVNGDLTPCIEHPSLEYVGFMDRRHYSHRFDCIQQILETRSKMK